MHTLRGLAVLWSLSLGASLVGACNGQQTPAAPPAVETAPAVEVAVAERGEPIAEYVVAAFADSKGVLWFGTMGKGVARYDGSKLDYLSPANGEGGNVVASVAEDRHGVLWFAGHEGTGVVKYDGETFTRLWADESRVRADRQGNIWASTRDAVFRSTGGGLSEFVVPLGSEVARAYTVGPGRVSMELEDSRGNLWFRSDGYGVIRHDGTSFKRFTTQDGLCSDTVWSIVEDRQGNLWFSCTQTFPRGPTGAGGVRRFDGATFTAFPDIKGLDGNDIYTLYVARSGDVWIGASHVGVYRYDGDRFTLYDQTDRPDLNGGFGLQGMTEDRHGTLWFAFSGGLFRLEGQRFVHVSQDGPWPASAGK